MRQDPLEPVQVTIQEDFYEISFRVPSVNRIIDKVYHYFKYPFLQMKKVLRTVEESYEQFAMKSVENGTYMSQNVVWK